MPLVNEEMFKFPEQDQRRLQFIQLSGQHPESAGLQPVAAGGFEYQRSLAAVPGNSAVSAQFFQRLVTAVISEDHPQRRRTALRRLHLKHDRSLFSAGTREKTEQVHCSVRFGFGCFRFSSSRRAGIT